jgi:hypothetical protein
METGIQRKNQCPDGDETDCGIPGYAETWKLFKHRNEQIRENEVRCRGKNQTVQYKLSEMATKEKDRISKNTFMIVTCRCGTNLSRDKNFERMARWRPAQNRFPLQSLSISRTLRDEQTDPPANGF